MKKTFVALMVAVAAVASSYAQGTVTFANTAGSLVRIQTSLNDSTLINMPVGGGAVELLWAPIGTTDLSLFTAVSTLVTANTTANGVTRFATAPGRFSAGAATVPVGTAGGGAAFVIRGWTGSALNWAEAIGGTGQIGWSSIFTLAATGNPLSVPPGTPVGITTGATPFTGLTLAYVPEPSSMALAGLGAASLLIFRRRK